MAWARRRPFVLLLVAGFLLTVTVAGSLHRHGHFAPDFRGACLAGHLETQVGSHATCLETSVSGRTAGIGGLGGESCAFHGPHGCPFCQFLSQKVSPSRAFEMVRVEPLRERAPQAQAVCATASPVRFERCRAPPTIA